MRLISWNLNGRVRDAPAQIAALLRKRPDVVALQEVTRSSLPLLRAALSEGGLPQIVDSFTLAPPDFTATGPRRYGQLTASRYPLRAEQPGRFVVPWPERVLSARLEVGALRIELHNTHVPPGATNGWIKIDVLDGIWNALAVPSTEPRILCGDFNTPQAELMTGEVVTWGQRLSPNGGWRIVRTRWRRPGRDWDLGERRVLTGLGDHDLADVYRALHGYEVSESSWFVRRSGRETGRRFDHVFASRSLVPLTCRYLHALRQSGLSDHAPIEVTFGIPDMPAPNDMARC